MFSWKGDRCTYTNHISASERKPFNSSAPSSRALRKSLQPCYTLYAGSYRWWRCIQLLGMASARLVGCGLPTFWAAPASAATSPRVVDRRFDLVRFYLLPWISLLLVATAKGLFAFCGSTCVSAADRDREERGGRGKRGCPLWSRQSQLRNDIIKII